MENKENKNPSLKDLIKEKCVGISERLNSLDTTKRKKIIIIFFVIGLIILFGNILITSSIHKTSSKEEIEIQATKDSLEMVVNEISLLIQTIDTIKIEE